MPSSRPPRRSLLRHAAAAALAVSALGTSLGALAQETPIKFQLDWRFEGPAAFFLWPVAKGHFKDEKLAVTVDAGNGSGNAVNRVASGTYDMGFADLAALMEFHANNPTAPNKPVAVMMVYNNTPAAVFSLKKSGIKTPADLAGKKLGAPVFDAGRRAFPIFQKANNVAAVNWISMDPPLRETMLARGDVDAITGFYFTSMLNLEARGVKAEDVAVMMYPQYGVKMYGNVIIASEEFLKKRPEAVKAFLRAFSKAAKEVIADPKAAVAVVKERDGIINADMEQRRLKLAIQSSIATADARTEGFGNVSPPRLALMASQVADAYTTKGRINPDVIWNPAFLPSAEDRNIFAGTKK
jgi:NitT/TauT family transport system substrate-binding protein